MNERQKNFLRDTLKFYEQRAQALQSMREALDRGEMVDLRGVINVVEDFNNQLAGTFKGLLAEAEYL